MWQVFKYLKAAIWFHILSQVNIPNVSNHSSFHTHPCRSAYFWHIHFNGYSNLSVAFLLPRTGYKFVVCSLSSCRIERSNDLFDLGTALLLMKPMILIFCSYITLLAMFSLWFTKGPISSAHVLLLSDQYGPSSQLMAFIPPPFLNIKLLIFLFWDLSYWALCNICQDSPEFWFCCLPYFCVLWKFDNHIF